ncbi:MAG: FAD-dependent oxidoreductase [Thaumarchaeota archaeon]|nr:FAD-dependent oxidoreductase [Nitrososphaerota archaeon]
MSQSRKYGNTPVTLTEPLTSKTLTPGEIPFEYVTTDVLVIGAGVGGCMAAMLASESGAEVALVEKAWVDRSGQAGAGNDHIMAHFNQGPDDSDEAVNKWAKEDTLCDVSIYDVVVTKNIPDVVRRLENFGIKFFKKRKTGEYLRTQSLGQPAPWWLMIRNADSLKPKMAAALRRSNVKLYNWVMTTSLFTKDGAVVGAAGFGIRKGTYYVFNSKCTILATGDVVRLATNSTGNPYNSFISPYGTGSAQALAFKAGAEIADLELGKATLIPKGFSSPGMNAIAGMDAHLINAKGERYMFHYHPLGEKAPRFDMVYGTMREIAEGRGPCYVDMRHLPEDERGMLIEELLSVDKLTYRDYLKAKRVDLSSALLEIEPGEISTWKGLLVNAKSQCSIPHLYAVGGCASIMNWGGLAVSMASGISAGREAAREAKTIELDPISEDVIQRERSNIYDMLLNPRSHDTLSPAQFEEKIRDIVAEYLSGVRNEKGLRSALQEIQKLEVESGRMRANDTHELMKLHEALHLLTTIKLLTIGAINRKESRIFHWRADYPSADSQPKHVVLKKASDGSEQQIVVETRDVS